MLSSCRISEKKLNEYNVVEEQNQRRKLKKKEQLKLKNQKKRYKTRIQQNSKLVGK